MPKASACPICKKPVIAEYAPFCSKRCADVDLNRWLTESYVVDGADDESAEVQFETPPPIRH